MNDDIIYKINTRVFDDFSHIMVHLKISSLIREGASFVVKGKYIHYITQEGEVSNICSRLKGVQGGEGFDFTSYLIPVEDEVRAKKPFTGFKKGYYYRYKRTDGVTTQVYWNGEMKKLMDGQWTKCVSVLGDSASFEKTGYTLWFWLREFEDFNDFFEEKSSEDMYEYKLPYYINKASDDVSVYVNKTKVRTY